jgi:hypothetical protein
MINAPFGRNSPLCGVLLTCSGSTQYACASANWFQAFEYDAAKIHVSSSVFSEIGMFLSVISIDLTMQLGAPCTSAWAYRSPSFRYFFTTTSFVFASLPATTMFPSFDMNHLNRSNQNCFPVSVFFSFSKVSFSSSVFI